MLKIKKYRIVMPKNIESFWWEDGTIDNQTKETQDLLTSKLVDPKNTNKEEIDAAYAEILADKKFKPLGIMIINFVNKNMIYITCTNTEFKKFEKEFADWEKLHQNSLDARAIA